MSGIKDTKPNLDDLLEMSDEDFEKSSQGIATQLDQQEDQETDTTESIDEETGADEAKDIEDTDETDNSDVETQSDEGETEEEDDDDESQVDDQSKDDTDTDDTGTSDNNNEIDYKAYYEAMNAPIKANGREYKDLKPDEQKQLMQMGLNYNKKMNAIKPHLKVIKTLEKADLLDEGKLNYLIDLSKKDPVAIQKLIKDSGIDPLEIDTDKEVNYVPRNYAVSNEEFEFSEAVASISDSPTYKETLNVVTKVWDDASRELLFKNPNLMRKVDEEITLGRFNEIQAIVDTQRALGKDDGKSDLELYSEIVTARENELRLKMQTSAQTVQKTEVKRDPVKVNQKKAAGITKKKAGNPQPKQIDPLSMSDEEFAKLIPGLA